MDGRCEKEAGRQWGGCQSGPSGEPKTTPHGNRLVMMMQKVLGVGVHGIKALRLTNAEAGVKENPWTNASFPAWKA